MVCGLGFGVLGLGFGVWGLGFGDWGLGFGCWNVWFVVKGLEFAVKGQGCGVYSCEKARAALQPVLPHLFGFNVATLQGYLAQKKHPPRRTLR